MDILKLNIKKKTSILDKAIEELNKGNLIIYPTETCYGLGADATNQQAVNKLLQFKTRREGKAISIAVANIKMAEQYAQINSTARNIYQNFLPGPLTVISKVKTIKNLRPPHPPLAKGIASEFQTIGIRIPKHDWTLNLIKKFNKPITATSANISYQSSPYSLEQWQKQTPKKSQQLINLWINAGQLPRRQPSTIVDTTLNELTILRQGKIKINQPTITYTTNSENETKQLAQKIIKKYYNPLNNQNMQVNNSTDKRPSTCLIFALQGLLGAGKTQFAKGIAETLKIKKNIKSPTFTLSNEYEIPFDDPKIKIKNHLFHIDTWRMEKAQELLDIEYTNMIRAGNIIIIEWAEKVQQILTSTLKNKKIPITIIWGTIKIISPQQRQWKFSVETNH